MSMQHHGEFKGFSLFFIVARKKRNFFLFERREKKGFRLCRDFFRSFMKNCWFLCMKSTAYVTFLGSLTRPSWEKNRNQCLFTLIHYIEHIKAVSFYDPNARSLPLSVLISFKYDFCIFFSLLFLFSALFTYFKAAFFFSSSMSLELLQWKQKHEEILYYLDLN